MAIPKRRATPWPNPKTPATRPPLRRMLWAIQRLQKGGALKATDLAREFEVSVRTAYRDLDFLRDEWRAHVPGACRRSPSDWLRTLGEARIARRPAIGLGEDFEIAAEGLIGSGVWFDGHPAHLSAFAPA